MKNKDVSTSLTHSRPEPEGEPPTERSLTFTEKQEELRTKAKNGNLGIKFDDEKTRFDLLPWNEVKQVADVFTLGAKKYADDNWKYVPDGKKRYFAAAMRHLVAWKEGEKYDGETKFNHLAHALCCIFFLLFLDNESENKSENNK